METKDLDFLFGVHEENERMKRELEAVRALRQAEQVRAENQRKATLYTVSGLMLLLAFLLWRAI